MITQIERHWTLNDVPEMTFEKLQMIATCNSPSHQKIKLLKWWNSSMPSREARKFPPKPVSEDKLGPLFNKCVWWSRISCNVNLDISIECECMSISILRAIS